MDKTIKLLEFIDKEIKVIEDDERHHYKPASVMINAPLALIQTSMKSRIETLKQIKSKILKGEERI